MRLLVVSWWMPYPPDNGTRQRAFNLLTHLSRHHAITLLTFGHTQAVDDIGPLRDLCERVDVVPPRTLPAGRLGVEGLLSTVPRYYAQTRSVEMTARVDAAARDHDALLALTCGAGLHMTGVAGLRPSVLDEIEVGVLRDQYTAEHRPVRRLRHGLTWWKYSRFIRSLASRFDRSTVVSEREREFLRSMRCDTTRIAVVANGVNVPATLDSRRKLRRLVYPGSVMYSANLDAMRYFVHDVWPIIRRAAPDVTLTVTGATDGVNLGGLEGAEGVTFTGRLPDIDDLVATSAACVVPLRIGGGTRLKVLHAMALATPVVSTSKGIEGLDVVPGHHLLVADSPEDLAASILRVVNDPALGAALAREGYALVRDKYAWGPIAHELERVILEAVDARRRPAR